MTTAELIGPDPLDGKAEVSLEPGGLSQHILEEMCKTIAQSPITCLRLTCHGQTVTFKEKPSGNMSKEKVGSGEKKKKSSKLQLSRVKKILGGQFHFGS